MEYRIVLRSTVSEIDTLDVAKKNVYEIMEFHHTEKGIWVEELSSPITNDIPELIVFFSMMKKAFYKPIIRENDFVELDNNYSSTHG